MIKQIGNETFENDENLTEGEQEILQDWNKVDSQ